MKTTTTLCLLLLLTGAAQAQEAIEADVSDFRIAGSLPSIGLDTAYVGDITSIDIGARFLLRFPLDALPADFTSAALQIALLETRTDEEPDPGIIDVVAPFANPGLGDLLAVPVPDYETPDASDYGATPVGDAVVLVAAGAEGPAFPSVDVTDAVRAAKDAPLPFATFRIETAIETDFDGRNDVWFLATTENASAEQRPLLIWTPEPGAAAAGGTALAALAWRRSHRR